MAIFAVILAFASCSEEYNGLESDIVTDQGLSVEVNREATVVAYSQRLAPFRSNNLTKYQLGIYNDPVFGTSQANILSQLDLSTTDPSFGDNATVDSVYVYIPYYSTATETVDEETTYTLDSIYGSSPIRLEFFESNYFLRNLDPTANFEELQNYYTDQTALFESNLGERLLEIPEFSPRTNEIDIPENNEEDAEITRLVPGIREALPVAFFQQRILDMAGSTELLSNSNFRNYLRGIYIKASSVSSEATLLNLNINQAVIDIKYSFDDEDEDNGRGSSDFKINFSNIAVNTFNNSLEPSIASELINVDRINGEENLYLQGGEGIISVIELFGSTDVIGYNDNGIVNAPNGTPDEIDEIRQKGWIINEANLVFHVNQDLIEGGDTEPERIFIYDLDNNSRLRDFELDPTSNNTSAIDAVTSHLGRLERGDDNNGVSYKIRITNYVNDLINRDSTSVKLGLVVAQDVVNPNYLELRNIQSPGIEFLPELSLQSPEGTILYGNATPNEEKRLTLEIYYTDPNQ